MQLLRGLNHRLSLAAVIATALAAVIALGITTGSTEAADDFADSVVASGTVADEGEATGPADGTAAHLDPGAALVLTFGDNVAFDGPGTDITVHFANDDGDDVADATYELSNDGVTWSVPVPISEGANVLLELGQPFVTAVRISNTDTTGLDVDLDAVEATNGILDTVTIDLAPLEAVNDIFENHEVTATVDDGDAVDGAMLTWEIVEGPNTGPATTDTTDASGQSMHSYAGTGGAGTDTITAYLDIDGSGVWEEGEPIGTATKRWLGVTGTIALTDIDGGAVALGDVLTITVEDSDLDLTDGLDTVMVHVDSDTDTVGFDIELTETAAHSGVFEGSIFLADTTDSGAGDLATGVGDTVTATYEDAIDDTGNPASVDATLDVESDTDEAGDKVTLCHVPSGNPGNQHTINVGAPARDAHLAHGDSLGECGEVAADVAAHGEPKDGFCEKHIDHKRCEDVAADEQESQSANLEVDDDDDDADGPAVAFCERHPDHRNCADGAVGHQQKAKHDDDADDGEAED